jgi:hypothetical protein
MIRGKQDMKNTIYIERNERNLNEFKNKFDKIVAKAKKYGVAIPTYTMKETEI